jgi:hypothetical protein
VSGWIVQRDHLERGGGGRVALYWKIGGWTQDADEALQFHRQIDAERALKAFLPYGHVTVPLAGAPPVAAA